MTASSIVPTANGSWFYTCTCGRASTHPTMRAARAARERHNAKAHTKEQTA